MQHKKSLLELFEELNPLLEKGKYFEAGMVAENYGYKELSKKYYNYAEKKFREEIILEQLKVETSPILKNALNYLPQILTKENNAKNEKLFVDSSLYQFYDIINELKNSFKRN